MRLKILKPNKMQLTSANSINVARWLPQLFYFLFAYKQAKSQEKADNLAVRFIKEIKEIIA